MGRQEREPFFISRQSREHKEVENKAKYSQSLMIQTTKNHTCDANSTNISENIKKQNMEKEQTNKKESKKKISSSFNQ